MPIKIYWYVKDKVVFLDMIDRVTEYEYAEMVRAADRIAATPGSYTNRKSQGGCGNDRAAGRGGTPVGRRAGNTRGNTEHEFRRRPPTAFARPGFAYRSGVRGLTRVPFFA